MLFNEAKRNLLKLIRKKQPSKTIQFHAIAIYSSHSGLRNIIQYAKSVFYIEVYATQKAFYV